ncbi:uncharacterized protein LOC143300665 [Babylonia areolata]|uniref:uncharacterized protein LOC143300665 n=1 Tax=Babylonia areolata TaxID=304850 RepID=UPI003FD120D8
MEVYWGIVIIAVVLKMILISACVWARAHRLQQSRRVVVVGGARTQIDQTAIITQAAPMGTSVPPRPPAGQYPPCPPPAYSRDRRGPYPHSQYPGARPPPANVHGSAPYVKQGPGPARRDPHDDPCLLQA